jgi:polar amino acid transport system substrate-binding protein
MCSDTEPPTGIDIHLIKEVGKRLGLSVVFKEYPFKRLLVYMKTGQIDIMPSLAKRPEREEYMIYLSPSYYSLGPTFYVKKGNERIIREYDDLYNTTVGMSAGSVFFEPFDSDNNVKKYPVSFELQLLKMLDSGRVDTIIGSNAQIDFLLRQQGLDGKIKKAVFRPEKITKVFLALSRESPFAKDAEKFNKALKDIIDDNMLEKFISMQCDPHI